MQYFPSFPNLVLCCNRSVYGLKPPAAGKRAQPGAAPCIATACDFVCQTVLKKRGAPVPAAGAAAAPAAAAAPDPIPAGVGAGARGGSAERGKAPPPLHLFHDEGLNSFFRRLAWSPEGACPINPGRLPGDIQEQSTCARGIPSFPTRACIYLHMLLASSLTAYIALHATMYQRLRARRVPLCSSAAPLHGNGDAGYDLPSAVQLVPACCCGN